MATINGTASADHLNGGSGDDTINGLGGNDTLNGGLGGDSLHGGDGNDTLIGGAGVNDFWGDAGHDRFVMVDRVGLGASDDLIHDLEHGDKIDLSAWGISDIEQVRQLLYTDSDGNAAFNAFYDGVDHVLRVGDIEAANLTSTYFTFATGGAETETGTAHDDTLFGSAANDVLNGGDGDDLLLGGAGNDVLSGGFGLDNYDGGVGFDRVSYAYSTDERVNANLATQVATFSDNAKEYFVSIEAVTGSQVADTITGSAGRNTIDGQGGNDVLNGGGGPDTLAGGLGADTMTGGSGNDVFVYRALSDSTVAASGQDVIADFATGDVMDMTRLEASVGESFHFVGTAAFSHTAGEIRYEIAGGHTVVSLDSDGNGTADFAIQLTGSHALTASDFLL